jgi:hypothetical protein
MHGNMAAGLGNSAVPAGYNRPGFGVGTAVLPGAPNPDAQLAAASAAVTPNGIDPLNNGYQLGGAGDPLAEFEPAADNPPGMSIGGGGYPAPLSSPGFPPMASGSFREYGTPADEADDPFAEDNPFAEDDPFAEDNPFAGDNPFAEDDTFGEIGGAQAFEDADAVPAFEDISDDPALAALPVDADGIIQPIVLPDEIVVEPELGEVPDAVLPFAEPVLDITEDDVDVEIPENAFENDGMPEAIPVVESFKLPENQRVVVSKGDQIFMLGHVREEFIPKFAECAFSRAMKSLAGSGRGLSGVFRKVGQRHEKVAVAGRSVLVEVAKDWRLPGTNIVFEAHDLLQIVSAKPMREGAEVEKFKKEYYLANRRRVESGNKRDEDDSGDDDDDDDSPDKAEKRKKKEREKREADLLKRQKTGGWI